MDRLTLNITQKKNSAYRLLSKFKEPKGYKIYGTSPVPGSMTIHELDPNQKIAVSLGKMNMME